MLALTLGYLSPLAHAAEVPKATEESGTFDLSFKGGTPQKLVSEMENASRQKLNVLIPPELADVKIPPMELRAVQTQGVFDTLNMLWRNSMQWIRASSSISTPVWVLSRRPEDRKTQVFYVGHLLKKFKIDDITTAVQTTWQLGGKEAKAELKYSTSREGGHARITEIAGVGEGARGEWIYYVNGIRSIYHINTQTAKDVHSIRFVFKPRRQ